MKHEKKYEIMGLLDDRIYEEVLQKREALSHGRIHRKGGRLRQMLLAAACVTALAIGVTAAFLPAMLSDPRVDTGVPTGSESTDAPLPDAEWVEDPTIVQVQRLSSIRQNFVSRSDSLTSDPYMTSADIVAESPGQRLIFIRFNCRENEQIVVTPSQNCAVSVVVQKESASGRPLWYRIDPIDGSEEYARELLTARRSAEYPEGETVLLGNSLTVSATSTLLWQYSDEDIPCAEDNFVDFTVVNEDGQITGGGSVYVGGLDLIPLTENKTYYDGNDARLNSIYRPCVLGAYRCSPVTEEQSDISNLHDKLHQKADGVRTDMFKDLSADSFKLSMRKLKQEQSRVFAVMGEDGSAEITVRVRCYRSDDRYAIVENHDRSVAFFLYNGIYQRIETTETDIVDEYGTMLKGRYILSDGTVVNVDFSKAPIYEVVPPAS